MPKTFMGKDPMKGGHIHPPVKFPHHWWLIFVNSLSSFFMHFLDSFVWTWIGQISN
jgi:hypothetical protein